jgi:glycosyltransferase involved in cell wall biosynthesis
VAYELLARLPGGYRRHLYCLARRTDRAAGVQTQAERLAEAGVTVRVPSTDDKATAVRELAGWLRDDGIDLVHTHSFKPNRYARPVALDAQLVTVAHFHNHYDDKWDSAVLDTERRLAARTSSFLACSASVRDHVVSRIGLDRERVKVIRNGVDMARFTSGDGRRVRAELGIPPRSPLIGTVGRMSRQKAQDDFLRAARLVAASYPQAVFAIVGGADDREVERELRELASALDLGSRVRFIGFRDDLADVYAALDVFVLTSRWEGLPLVLAEAMAAAVPVVATTVGSVPEVVGGAGLLVSVGDAARVASAVCELLARPDHARQMAGQGRTQAARMGWAAPAADLADHYAELLGHPAVPS